MALLSVEPDGDADPFHTHTVWRDGRAGGIVTSAAPGHRTGATLALAWLRPEADSRKRHVPGGHGRPARMDGRGDGSRENGRGGALEISILGHRRPARVLAEPPYDPMNTRLRGVAGG